VCSLRDHSVTAVPAAVLYSLLRYKLLNVRSLKFKSLAVHDDSLNVALMCSCSPRVGLQHAWLHAYWSVLSVYSCSRFVMVAIKHMVVQLSLLVIPLAGFSWSSFESVVVRLSDSNALPIVICRTPATVTSSVIL